MKIWCEHCRRTVWPKHPCDNDWTQLDNIHQYVLIFNGRANYVGTDLWIKNTLEPLRTANKPVHVIFVHYATDSVDKHMTSVNGFGDMQVTPELLARQRPKFRMGAWQDFVGKHFRWAQSTETILVDPVEQQPNSIAPGGWKNQYLSLANAYAVKPQSFHWRDNTAVLRMRWDGYIRFEPWEQCDNFWDYLSLNLRTWEIYNKLYNFAPHFAPLRRAVIGQQQLWEQGYLNQGQIFSHDMAHGFDGSGLRYLCENFDAWNQQQPEYQWPEMFINNFFIQNKYDISRGISGGVLRDLDDPTNRDNSMRARGDDYRLRWYTYFA